MKKKKVVRAGIRNSKLASHAPGNSQTGGYLILNVTHSALCCINLCSIRSFLSPHAMHVNCHVETQHQCITAGQTAKHTEFVTFQMYRYGNSPWT